MSLRSVNGALTAQQFHTPTSHFHHPAHGRLYTQQYVDELRGVIETHCRQINVLGTTNAKLHERIAELEYENERLSMASAVMREVSEENESLRADLEKAEERLVNAQRPPAIPEGTVLVAQHYFMELERDRDILRSLRAQLAGRPE